MLTEVWQLEAGNRLGLLGLADLHKPRQVQTHVVSGSLDILVRLCQLYLGLFLGLCYCLLFLRVTEAGVEMSDLLLHRPPVDAVGAGLPLNLG
jgi:hypothetical protein